MQKYYPRERTAARIRTEVATGHPAAESIPGFIFEAHGGALLPRVVLRQCFGRACRI